MKCKLSAKLRIKRSVKPITITLQLEHEHKLVSTDAFIRLQLPTPPSPYRGTGSTYSLSEIIAFLRNTSIYGYSDAFYLRVLHMTLSDLMDSRCDQTYELDMKTVTTNEKVAILNSPCIDMMDRSILKRSIELKFANMSL